MVWKINFFLVCRAELNIISKKGTKDMPVLHHNHHHSHQNTQEHLSLGHVNRQLQGAVGFSQIY